MKEEGIKKPPDKGSGFYRKHQSLPRELRFCEPL